MNSVSQFEALCTGTEKVIPIDALEAKVNAGKKLTVKLGMDPTAPDLHLGHAVVLSKLKQFQDFGHHAVLVIGDFTASIGDPTGRSKTRPSLTDKQIQQNMQTYLDQAGKILDLNKVSIRYNSEWLDKLTSADFVKLCAKVTVAQIIERDDFQKRLKANAPISLHELLYPLAQGYDSVVLQSDVELGGTDQTFNLLMGRTLQEHYGQDPQAIITTPLLEGLDGVHKMSKSYGNTIGLTESANQAFGKLMSISDDLMWRYAHVLLHMPQPIIADKQQSIVSGALHPMKIKKQIAHDIVARFWSDLEAIDAQKQFEAVFQKKDYSQAQQRALPADTDNPIWIVQLLKLLGAVQSSSEAKRLITSGAVHVDGEVVSEFGAKVSWHNGTTVKVGKHRIYKISLLAD